MSPLQWFVAALCGWILREQDDVIAFLREENRVLRAHLRGPRLHLSDEERQRLAVLGHQLGRAALAQVATIATADTILRWHRELTARRCAPPRRRSGRPRVEAAVRSLIRRMAIENATWGYTRIQGALKNLGHCVGRSTIARILKEQAIPPSGRRPMAWRTFIGAHCPALLASNLFTSLAGTLRGLVIHSMALLPELRTRGVQPYTSPWLPDNGFLRQAMRAFTSRATAHLRSCGRIRARAVDVARWSEPAARTSGCPRGPDSRPHIEQPWLYRTVRLVDAAEGPQPRRVTSTVQAPGGTHGIGDAVPWRARSPTAPERVDRISVHATSASSDVPWLASPDHQPYAA